MRGARTQAHENEPLPGFQFLGFGIGIAVAIGFVPFDFRLR